MTTEICARSDSWVAREMSWPSIRMRPPSRSKKRSSRLITVDLPAPERPTRPIFSPGSTVRVKPVEHAGLAAVAEAHVLKLDARRAVTASGRASASSVSCSGRAIVIMPSCTTPISSKISVTENATQRDMLVSWNVSGSTMAMAPTSTAPWSHSVERDRARRRRSAAAFSTASSVPNAVIRRCCAR